MQVSSHTVPHSPKILQPSRGFTSPLAAEFPPGILHTQILKRLFPHLVPTCISDSLLHFFYLFQPLLPMQLAQPTVPLSASAPTSDTYWKHLQQTGLSRRYHASALQQNMQTKIKINTQVTAGEARNKAAWLLTNSQAMDNGQLPMRRWARGLQLASQAAVQAAVITRGS